jgi:hypothetical protein
MEFSYFVLVGSLVSSRIMEVSSEEFAGESSYTHVEGGNLKEE